MSIDLLVPSRGRPDAAKELLHSFRATRSLETTRLRFLVDSDDSSQNYYPTDGCDVLFDAPTGDPTGPLNAAALRSDATIVGFMGDDSRCATPGWDALVERALVEPGFAWGWDRPDFFWASTCFANTELVRAMGYFVLPTLRRGFFDCQWMLTARSASAAHEIRASFPHDNSAHPVAPEVVSRDQDEFEKWRTGGGGDRDAKIVRHRRDLAHFFPPDLIFA